MAAISHNSNMGYTFTQLKYGVHLVTVKHCIPASLVIIAHEIENGPSGC